MAEMRYREALNAALREEMERDETVLIMGEDIGVFNGAFKVTQGLLEDFGEKRVRDTPISENTIVGVGVGAAMTGLRPIVELMTVNFSLLAMDQIVNHMSTIHYMFGGQVTVPMVVRMPQGAGHQLGPTHSHCLEAIYSHVPGMLLAVPSTPADAKGLLKSAIRDDNPVVFIEHESLYGLKGEVPDEPHLVPVRPGRDPARGRRRDDRRDLTDGADRAEGGRDPRGRARGSAEVIDPRTLRPLDLDTILESVRHTNRCVIVEEGWPHGGVGANLAALIQEQAFDFLDAPIARVTGADLPMPYSKPLEQIAFPHEPQVVDTVLSLLLTALRSQGLLQPRRLGCARRGHVPLNPRSRKHADTPAGGGDRRRPRCRGAGYDQRHRLLASRGPTHHARPERRQHGRVRVRVGGRAGQAEPWSRTGSRSEPGGRPVLREARSRPRATTSRSTTPATASRTSRTAGSSRTRSATRTRSCTRSRRSTRSTTRTSTSSRRTTCTTRPTTARAVSTTTGRSRNDVPVAPDNVGPKTMPNYAAGLQRRDPQHARRRQDVRRPADDPFFIDLGTVFDGINIDKPGRPAIGLGNQGGGKDDVSGYNTHSFVLQVPTSEVTRDGGPVNSAKARNAVVGVWSTTERRAIKVNDTRQGRGRVGPGQPPRQPADQRGRSSRSAMKDKYNATGPATDGKNFGAVATNPEPARILNALFGLGIKETNRTDIVQALLTGVPGLTQISPNAVRRRHAEDQPRRAADGEPEPVRRPGR